MVNSGPRVGATAVAITLGLVGTSGWASEPFVELPICAERNRLVEAHPDKYRRRSIDWKLPSTVRFRSSNYATFLAEDDERVRMEFPESGSIERVRAVLCDYDRSISYPLQPVGYRDTSYAHVLLPGETSRWAPPKQVLQILGYSVSKTAQTVSAQVDISRLDWPASIVDVNATYGVVVEILASRPGARGWSRLGMNYYLLRRSERIKRTVYATLPAGHQRVKVVVKAMPFATKPMSLKVHAARLRGVRGAELIQEQLERLGERGTSLVQRINLRTLLHERYLKGADGVLCAVVNTVERIQEATELLLLEELDGYREWRDSFEGSATFWLADELLGEAQRQGGIPDAADPWEYLAEQRDVINLRCAGRTITAPSEQAFDGLSGETREKGVANARVYQVLIAALRQLQADAAALVALIDAPRIDHPWTTLEF